MATQIGMTMFTPLQCARSVAQAGSGAVPRWQRIALEACKQSRRAYLPTFAIGATPVQVTADASARGESVLLADPGGEPLQNWQAPNSRGLTLIVGPEGGLTEAEIDGAVANGAHKVTLGTNILRVETAAIVLLAITLKY